MSHNPTRSSQRPRGLSLSIALTLVAMLTMAAAAVAGDWKGSEQTIDETLHMMNPVKGMEKPASIELEEMFRVGGYDEDVLFGVVGSIMVGEDGNFYMLDTQLNEIQIFSPEGEYVRTIGREGEGPGEFRGALSMMKMPGGNIGVLQAFPSKIVMLTPEGDPAGDFPLPEVEGAGFRVLFSAAYAGENLALMYGRNQPSEKAFTQSNVLALVTADGSSETILHTQDSTMDFASAEISEREWDSFRNRWTATADGRVMTVPEFGKYKVKVWDAQGKTDRIIEREYPTHKRNAEQTERILEIYKGFTRQIPIPNIKYDIEENFSPVSQVYGRDDGTLWVQTSRGTVELGDGVLAGYDVYDAKGQFVQEVTLRGEGDPIADGIHMVGDYIVVVTDFLNGMMRLQGGGGGEGAAEAEEDVEPMEVIVYRLNAPSVGMR